MIRMIHLRPYVVIVQQLLVVSYYHTECEYVYIAILSNQSLLFVSELLYIWIVSCTTCLAHVLVF